MWPIGCFAGKRVLVVGGTSGIGGAIARAFVEEGAAVTATSVSSAELEAAASLLPNVRLIAVDVRDAGQISCLVEGEGALDHVVYAAGIIKRGREHEPEVFADVLDVNLAGAMRVANAVRSKMTKGTGSLLFVASMLSFFGGGPVPAYSASKGGIAQLTKSLAIAYAPDGIRVNAVAPGWIETPLTRQLREDPDRSRAILNRTPMGRWGKPEDLQGAALFLASPLAAFITGTVLPVDGGYLVA